MNLDHAKNLINNYRLLVNDGNTDLLRVAFQNADVVTFESANFEEIVLDYMLVHLGYEDENLFTILTTDNKYPSKWNDETKFFVSKFVKNQESNVPDYDNGYVNPADSNHSNYISEATALNRIKKWNNTKDEWLNRMISENNVVRLFELPTAGFTYGATNHLTLGIDEFRDIDLMLGNDSGLYDMARPVPPFPRKTDWGF